MLMEILVETYRDITARLVPEKRVPEAETQRPAANAAQFSPPPVSQRRRRRLRRPVSAEQRRINGWTVRTW